MEDLQGPVNIPGALNRAGWGWRGALQKRPVVDLVAVESEDD